jgi:excisionase family DNA binding protein
MEPRRWRSILEISQELGVSTKTIRRWIATGDLPVLRIRHTLRIDAAALEARYREQQKFNEGGKP